MASYKRTVRLSKVAREFNMALDTVVDFFDKKGYKIDKNPNTKIDLNMYEVIEAEFSDSLEEEFTNKGRNPITEMTDEERILNLIISGENKTVEFKETFNKNLRTNLKDKEIQKASLKNIIGFLNADGGTLLIGVHDSGKVTGIDDDFYQSDDKYLLNFRNAIYTKVGSQFYSLIDWNIFEINGKEVLKVECQKSNEPCFYEDVEFFVRTNPATDKLEGKKQWEYIKKRF